MSLVVGVLTDATGNSGARLIPCPTGPDGAPIDAVGLIIVNPNGTPVSISALDTVFGAGWDGSVAAASQNSIYDKIISLTKADVGLSNVDNTSDANKPVSTAQAAAIALKINATEKGAASGVASLDSGGKIVASQLPSVSLVSPQLAASQAAQLALTTQEGDIVVRSDQAKTYMRNSGVTGTMTDFTELQSPTASVVSVAGLTGTILAAALKTALALVAGDVGLGNVTNTSDANKPVSTAQQAALDLKANIAPVLQTVASAATVTPAFSTNDAVNITAQAAGLTLANWSGTAVDFWGMVVRIKDNGTARAIAYGTNYLAADTVTLPTTTVGGKTIELAIQHNSATGKHVVVGVVTY